MAPFPEEGPVVEHFHRARVRDHAVEPLVHWEAARCAPDLHGSPASAAALQWLPAEVPGTAAAVLARAGLWTLGEPYDFDAEDWWFRARLPTGAPQGDEELSLLLGGLATVAEVYLDGELALESDSMFTSHALALGAERVGAELSIRFRALGPLLEQQRSPRARWRTRLAHRNLRFHRTMLLGRAPGFAPGPAAVGPYRQVALHRARRLAVDALRLQPAAADGRAAIGVSARLRPLGGRTLRSATLVLRGADGEHRAELALAHRGGVTVASGRLELAEPRLWWPHTHGEPARYEVALLVRDDDGEVAVDAGRTGFRELAAGPSAGSELERDGLDLHVNGVRVFARGALWTPADPVGLAPAPAELREQLGLVREAGLNMLRIPGTAAYETATFHDLCDELGILLWQDFMFANYDYPIADEGFRASVEREAQQALDALAGRPSLAVLCGNSEVEQQVAMLGLDPALGRGELFGELLPDLAAQATDALYAPSAPCGGALPFRPSSGVANYFGVGGYMRPLEDARRAGVRFASECLAFSNPPSDPGFVPLLDAAAESDPVLASGVPRDVGADWDFRDVSDHYLRLLYGLDPVELRERDPDHYLELWRLAPAEAMAEVFGEWRRAASPCGGGLVLWLRDVIPGAGWGLVDRGGSPKVALHHLGAVLAPVAVWTIDEGLGGIAVHVANDTPHAIPARLRVALYRDRELRTEEIDHEFELCPRGQLEWDLEGLLGRFVDASWAYRFGPAAQDVIVATLHHAGEQGRVLARAVRFPAGRPAEREDPSRLGLRAEAVAAPGGCTEIVLQAERLAHGVRISASGWRPGEEGFFLEPGVPHRVVLTPLAHAAQADRAELRAANMQGVLHVDLGGHR